MYPPFFEHVSSLLPEQELFPSLDCGTPWSRGGKGKWSSSSGGQALSHEAPASGEIFADLHMKGGSSLEREMLLLGWVNSQDSWGTLFSGHCTCGSQGFTLRVPEVL